MERNVIGKKTTIIGDIISEGDFRVDGSLEGNLKTKGRVIIGAEGLIKGNVEALNADIEGKISGKLEVQKTLSVKAAANISGEVIVGKLSIEPGAAFNATCVMRVVVDEKIEDEKNSKESKKTIEKPFQNKT
ncbi:MAG: polymer-forming cytoskeletal protein [Flavobacteriaceae bacterium]|nr:polymer-forming cytoskeletal protein [Flavobacteriaceae bacterium]